MSKRGGGRGAGKGLGSHRGNLKVTRSLFLQKKKKFFYPENYLLIYESKNNNKLFNNNAGTQLGYNLCSDASLSLQALQGQGDTQ